MLIGSVTGAVMSTVMATLNTIATAMLPTQESLYQPHRFSFTSITTAAKLPLLNRQPDAACKAEAHLDCHGRRSAYRPLVKASRVDVFAPSV